MKKILITEKQVKKLAQELIKPKNEKLTGTFEILKPTESVNTTPENDTSYVLHDDFFRLPKNTSSTEEKIAKKYLSFFNTSLENKKERLILKITPEELFNFIIHLQKEISQNSRKK